MIYNDGVATDSSMRVIQCPRCENEAFSAQAGFCKICGLTLFNQCDGAPVLDNFGNQHDIVYHHNPADARFCETCGNQTEYFKNGVLKAWDVIREQAFSQQQYHSNVVQIDPFQTQQQVVQQPIPVSDDDLPF